MTNEELNLEQEAVEEQTAPEAEAEETAEAGDVITAELAASREKYMRLAAEYDNFRKRSARERDALFTDVRADTVKKFLPVYDTLL